MKFGGTPLDALRLQYAAAHRLRNTTNWNPKQICTAIFYHKVFMISIQIV